MTVFGCTGFLGRYVVSKLGECVALFLGGARYIFPMVQARWARKSSFRTREEDDKRHLKPTGDLGQTSFPWYGYNPILSSIPVVNWFIGMGHPQL